MLFYLLSNRKKCYLKSVMRSENMRPGGYEGSVAGAVYLEEDDNGTQREDTRGKILLEIRERCPCTTVENAVRGITGELLDLPMALRLRVTSSNWNQANRCGDMAGLWFFLMKESMEENGPVHTSRAVRPDEETKHVVRRQSVRSCT